MYCAIEDNTTKYTLSLPTFLLYRAIVPHLRLPVRAAR
jgi:hypothetical protein